MVKYVLVSMLLYFLFFVVCYLSTGDDKKNIKNFYSYSDEIQLEIRKCESLNNMIPNKQSAIKIFVLNLLFFSGLMTGIGIFLHISNTEFRFFYFLILGESLNLFDLVIIDYCWWRNTKRTKFAKIKEEQSYLNMKKHWNAFLRGIPLFVVVAILSNFITMMFLN